MKKLVQKLNSNINQWLITSGFNCTVRFGNIFQYDYFNKLITYTLFDDEPEDELFIEVCKSIYEDVTIYDDFIISFLHELGHYMTEQHLNDADYEYLNYYNSLEAPTANQKLEYFVSFPEWEATDWACNYMKDNPENVNRLAKIIDNARQEFFNYYMKEQIDESN